MFNAPGSIQVQTPSHEPPLKALLSRQLGTAWARIIFQPLDCRCCVVARLRRWKQHNLVRVWQSLMSLWPKSSGRTVPQVDNVLSLGGKLRGRGGAARARPVERAPGGATRKVSTRRFKEASL